MLLHPVAEQPRRHARAGFVFRRANVCLYITASRTEEIDMTTTRVQEVLDKVKALREYTQRTGFRTTRSQNDLIQSLDGEELAEAVLALKLDTTGR